LRLIDLVEGDDSQVAQRAISKDTDIVGLTCDSRLVEPGFLFAALAGARADGRAFIPEAMRRGAAAVLAPPGTRIETREPPVPLLVDDNPRRRFALMAARFFASQPRTVAAVTGTNGKTSVVSFLRQVWTRLGRQAAGLGTLGIAAPGLEVAGSLTTPDPVELHRILADLAGRGVECLAMEASSHGLAQHRLDGVRVAAGAFTNLSRDHLDYHGSMESYLEAKTRLFSDIMGAGGVAVVNADGPYGEAVRAACAARGHRIITYGAGGEDIRLEDAAPLPEGQRLRLTVMGRAHTVTLPLVGVFQAENALCALGLALACGEDETRAVAALEGLDGAPGRVQRIAGHPGGAAVFVDYAHTPDALANVLGALRPHARGRLFVVFGCGGDRDPGKRPQMGRTACALADVVIVTDDNPRSEDAARIRRQILAACEGARDIADRRQAIAAAVAELRPGDLLVVAGKGHEQGQIVGDEVRPFDDAEVLRAAIGELGR
jgi:UDP-N-acetylmuramoyl-L-alanyl-D-glutamate--2,6-diaminopimelate ligase